MPSLDPLAWVWIAAISLLAYVVRGLSGFGAAMIAIGGLSQLLPPALVVPAVLIIEVLAVLSLLPGLRHQIDWRSLRWVLLASALATPLGTTVLARLPAEAMRLAVSGVLLAIAAWMLWRDARARGQVVGGSGHGAAWLAGGLSGLLNGAFGIGGPPVIVLYFSRATVAVGRATLIAYFLISDLVAIGLAGANGLVTADTGWLVLSVLPFALIGVWLGNRLYLRLDEARLRRTIWGLLAFIGAAGLLRAGLGAL